MKETNSSHDKQDMNKNNFRELDSRLAKADPALNQEAPLLALSTPKGVGTNKGIAIRMNRKTWIPVSAFSFLAILALVASGLNSGNTNPVAQTSNNLVLNSLSAKQPSFGVHWKPGQVAAEYNYHLSGIDKFSTSTGEDDVYLIAKDKDIEKKIPGLLNSLGIMDPAVTVTPVNTTNGTQGSTTYVDPQTKAKLWVDDKGSWGYSNPMELFKYASPIHTNHTCASAAFSNCTNSWTDILDLPTSGEALARASNILSSGGFNASLSYLGTYSDKFGIPEGHTNRVSISPDCVSAYSQTQEDQGCANTDPNPIAYRDFYVEFASGGSVYSAGGRFFQLINLGSFKTKSPATILESLKDYHLAVGWLSAPADPPASEHRINIDWTIVDAYPTRAVFSGYDSDGQPASFIVPAYNFKLHFTDEPHLNNFLTFSSVGSESPTGSDSGLRSNYKLPDDKQSSCGNWLCISF
jgi:hypothetical protein